MYAIRSYYVFDAPPITIGVVSFKFSLTGGIEIPCSISVKGNIVTSFVITSYSIHYTKLYELSGDKAANIPCEMASFAGSLPKFCGDSEKASV